MRSMLCVLGLLTACRLASASPRGPAVHDCRWGPACGHRKGGLHRQVSDGARLRMGIRRSRHGSKADGSHRRRRRRVPNIIESSGIDYDHNPVHERFSVVGDRARWESGAEHREQSKPGRAFYLSRPRAQSPKSRRCSRARCCGRRTTACRCYRAARRRSSAWGRSRSTTASPVGPSSCTKSPGSTSRPSRSGSTTRAKRSAWASPSPKVGRASERSSPRRKARGWTRVVHGSSPR